MNLIQLINRNKDEDLNKRCPRKKTKKKQNKRPRKDTGEEEEWCTPRDRSHAGV
jgi:hypothetical protein